MANFFLIDFENVQPKMLGRLKPGTARIKVFLGQSQTKLLLELVQALQPFGSDAEYIQISGSGPDAVDFHIAFYIGRLASAEPAPSFTIISKDKGFDPLVKHLGSLGIKCRRVLEIPPSEGSSVPSLPPTKVAAPAKSAVVKAVVAKSAAAKAPTAAGPKASSATSTKARVNVVVGRLRKSTKPATLTKLHSSVRSFFQPPLDAKAVDAVLQSLKDSKKVMVVGAKVTYALG